MTEPTELSGAGVRYEKFRPPTIVHDPEILARRCEDMFWVASQIEPRPYRFARTLANIPHSYSLRRQWEDPEAYDRVRRLATHYGQKTWYRTPGSVNGYYYRELWVNGYTYWAIDYILNRRRIYYPSVYDDLAPTYDSSYTAPQFTAEKEEVRRLIGPIGPDEQVLDIGSGTGLLLDLYPDLKPEQYTGLEPSVLMSKEFSAAHPAHRHRLVHCVFEDYWPWHKQFDVVLALFGAGEAVYDIFKLRRMLKPQGRAYIMRYGQGDPSFWKRFNIADVRHVLYPELAEALGEGKPIGEHLVHALTRGAR